METAKGKPMYSNEKEKLEEEKVTCSGNEAGKLLLGQFLDVLKNK